MFGPEVVLVSYILAPPQKLWLALTDGGLTQRYWYGRRIESSWQLEAPVCFYAREDDALTDSGKLIEYDPPRRLVYTFQNELFAAARAAGHSRVAFDLEPHGALTKLTLTHDGIREEETAAAWREGWAPILSSLKTLLETGAPLPELPEFVERGRRREH